MEKRLMVETQNKLLNKIVKLEKDLIYRNYM